MRDRARVWVIAGCMLALGAAGSAVAGAVGSQGIADNSVASVDVKNQDLRSIDVKDNEIRSRDIRDGSIGLADLDQSATQAILKYHKTANAATDVLYNKYGLKIEANCFVDIGAVYMTGVFFTSTSDNSIGIKSFRTGGDWASAGEQDADFDTGDLFINNFSVPAQGETDVVTAGGVHTHVTWLAWGGSSRCDFYGRVTVSP